MQIKTTYTGCPYLTAGKIYKVLPNSVIIRENNTMVAIIDDDGVEILLVLENSAHLDGNSWEVVENNNAL